MRLYWRLYLCWLNWRIQANMDAEVYHSRMQQRHRHRFDELIRERNAYADYHGLPAKPRRPWRQD